MKLFILLIEKNSEEICWAWNIRQISNENILYKLIQEWVTKSGVLFDEADEFISDCKSNYNLNIVGLMCLPPIDEDPRNHFSKLADLAKKFNLNCLSMGMSGDYKVALECGATHIRIGTHIFGERN